MSEARFQLLVAEAKVSAVAKMGSIAETLTIAN